MRKIVPMSQMVRSYRGKQSEPVFLTNPVSFKTKPVFCWLDAVLLGLAFGAAGALAVVVLL